MKYSEIVYTNLRKNFFIHVFSSIEFAPSSFNGN
jgi:hypothetical protein